MYGVDGVDGVYKELKNTDRVPNVVQVIYTEREIVAECKIDDNYSMVAYGAKGSKKQIILLYNLLNTIKVNTMIKDWLSWWQVTLTRIARMARVRKSS